LIHLCPNIVLTLCK